MPLQGIDLPEGAVAFPVGHRATITVAIPHDPAAAAARDGRLPGTLPPSAQVARAWLAAAERASRMLVPDTTTAQCVVRERCQLMLDGPVGGAEAPIEFLLAIGELVRMGSVAEAWIPELADAVAALPRHADDPLLGAALDAAERVCAVAGEHRAVKDLRKVRDRLVRSTTLATLPTSVEGVRGLAALERFVATGTDLLPSGIPAAWWGQNFEVYGVPTGPTSEVSFAVRWHGERPAVLWECTGDPVTLTSTGAAPGWSTSERTGETLWPAPVGSTGPAIDGTGSPGVVITDDGPSFS
jgi:hypothetical protein